MLRVMLIGLALMFVVAATAGAEEGAGAKAAQTTKAKEKKPAENPSDAKELSGMSIVGNDEAPKSLYIVPWKSSEIGMETDLSMYLNEGDVPVDRDVFKRQLDYYQVRTAQ